MKRQKPPTAKPSQHVRKMIETYKARRRLEPRQHCEVITVRGVADALGDHCERLAIGYCSDCGTSICAGHTEQCAVCGDVFCPSCMSFHKAQATHPKPETVERKQRKIA